MRVCVLKAVWLNLNEMQFVKNQFYWVEDTTECYIPAKLLNTQPTQNNDYQFEVYQTGAVIWVNKSLIYGVIPSPGEITLKTLFDDLTDSIDISEASVLWNLKQRYYDQNIYSGWIFFVFLFVFFFLFPTFPSLLTRPFE